jgi:hypothetical protein
MTIIYAPMTDSPHVGDVWHEGALGVNSNNNILKLLPFDLVNEYSTGAYAPSASSSLHLAKPAVAEEHLVDIKRACARTSVYKTHNVNPSYICFASIPSRWAKQRKMV